MTEEYELVKGRDVALNSNEVKVLKNDILNTYHIVCEMRGEVPSIKINSNPSNYTHLNDTISIELQKRPEITKHKEINVGVRFLCKLLFDAHKEGVESVVVRSSKLKMVKAFVESVPIKYERTYSIYYLINSDDTLLNTVSYIQTETKKMYNLEIHESFFEDTTDRLDTDTFFDSLYDDNHHNIILINRALMCDALFVKSLILLFKEMIFEILSSNIIFLIDKSDDDWNILTAEGKISTLTFWSKKLQKLKIKRNGIHASQKVLRKRIQEEIDSYDFLVKYLDRLFVGLTETYYTKWGTKPKGLRVDVPTYQPMLDRIIYSPDEFRHQLSDLYLTDEYSEREQLAGCDFKSVIAYTGYYLEERKDKMCKHFEKLNNKLLAKGSENTIERIFVVRSTYQPELGLVSKMNKSMNSIVIAYLKANYKSGVNAKILFLNEEINKNRVDAILQQDYILRMTKDRININDTINLTFPFKEKAQEQMLSFHSKNGYSLKVWVQDFERKLSVTNSPNSFAQLLDYKKDETIILYKLGLIV